MTENLHFEPVNMGQALGVLADVVASYVSTVHTPAIEDKKKATQLYITIFLHSLLMRSKHKAEMANLLDLISTELRAAAEAEADAEGGDPCASISPPFRPGQPNNSRKPTTGRCASISLPATMTTSLCQRVLTSFPRGPPAPIADRLASQFPVALRI